MAVKDVIKVNRKTFFNPKAWFDYKFIRMQHQYIKDTLKELFTVPTPAREETFEQAMKRLNVTEAEVDLNARSYRIYAILFVICGLAIFLYGFYLLFRYGSFFPWLAALAIAALFATQAFRYDFWSYQLRSRKLGVSFEEWKQNVLGK